MAIDGTTIKEAEFWDADAKQVIKVNLSVRDIIFFRLLQKLESAALRIGK